MDNQKKTVEILFQQVGPFFKTRTSGFTRIITLPARKGDNAKMARIEWTEKVELKAKEPKVKAKKTEKIKTVAVKGGKEGGRNVPILKLKNEDLSTKSKRSLRQWHLIDAKGEILGRLATKIANYLTGKNKTTYSTHMDMGDFVVVINAEKIEVTGKKGLQKAYRTHSGYPGGFKEKSYQQVMEVHPERILEHAVSGMIPDNRLKDPRMLRLKIVSWGQKPIRKTISKVICAKIKKLITCME